MSLEEKPTQADLLRVWIGAKLDKDTKFYRLQSASKQDRIDFVNANPELNTNEKRVKPSFHKILDELLKERKINRKEAKVTRKKTVTFNTSDMAADVQAQPQNVGAPNQQQQQQSTTNDNDRFAPMTGNQMMPGGAPQPNQPYINPNMTVDSIGGLCQGGMIGLKSIWPDLELLNDEEKKSISNILLPPLSRISDERIQLYLFPLLGVFGIIGPKIGKARNLKKEKNLKKKKDEQVAKEKKESKQDA